MIQLRARRPQRDTSAAIVTHAAAAFATEHELTDGINEHRWTWVVGFNTLMQESERVIRHAADNGPLRLRAVTRPVIDDAIEHATWKRQHTFLMQRVADRRTARLQLLELRQVIMSTIHRTALVSTVRKHQLQFEPRAIILAHFRPHRDLDEAWAAELQEYGYAQATSVCARHLARKVGDDLGSWLPEYREAFSHYFADYCRMILAEHDGQAELWRNAVVRLKQEVASTRKLMLTGVGPR